MQRGRAALQVLLIAAWCALTAGLLEGLRHAIVRYGMQRMVWISVDGYWLAPLSYLAIFAGPAAVLAIAAWLRPRWLPLWLPALVFAAPGAFGVLWLLARGVASTPAIAVLALGMGVQFMRVARSRPEALLKFVRRTAAAMAAFVLALTLWALAGQPLRERLQVASLAALPPAATNVLLIILDTVRGQNLSLYGYPRPTTPNLDRLAAEGVVFDDAIAPAPWTLPSHASMFTGRWPHELSADWKRPLDRSQPTLAESFRERGYVTAGFTANLIYTGRDAGLGRGFIHYRARQRTAHQLLLSSFLGQAIETWRLHWRTFYPHTDRKLASDVTGEFLGWLDGSEGRPFFAFLNFFDAHMPYYAPPAFRQRFRSGHRDVDAYDAAIAYIDDELGRLFRELDRRGTLDNTIVVVAADHGDLFGEHGLHEHGNSLYEALIRVPLIFRHPGTLPAGRRIGGFVSLRDLPATLAQLTGGSTRLPGHSLAALWSDSSRAVAPGPVLSEVSRAIRGEPYEPASKGDMKSLFGEPYQYIRNGDGTEELYDVRRDRQQLADLIATPQGAHVARRMGDHLDFILSGTRSGRAALAR